MDTLGCAYEAAVAQDVGAGMIGVAGPVAVEATETRLSLAVLPVPVAAPGAGLAAPLRWYQEQVDAPFRALVGDDEGEAAESGGSQAAVEARLPGPSRASGGAHHGGEALVFHADGCWPVLVEVACHVPIGLTLALGVPAVGTALA